MLLERGDDGTSAHAPTWLGAINPPTTAASVLKTKGKTQRAEEDRPRGALRLIQVGSRLARPIFLDFIFQ